MKPLVEFQKCCVINFETRIWTVKIKREQLTLGFIELLIKFT